MTRMTTLMQASRVTGPQVLSQRWFASSSSYHFDLHAGKDKFLGVLAAPLIIYVWGENKVSVSGYIIAYNVCVEGFKRLSGSIPLMLAFVLHDRSSALTTISWRSTMWTSFTLTTLSVFCFWEKAILTSKDRINRSANERIIVNPPWFVACACWHCAWQLLLHWQCGARK